MRTFLLLSMCLMLPVAVTAAPAKKVPTSDKFLGKWTGKWDGKWKVQFTVTRARDKSLAVTYEWEEYPGNPMQVERFKGRLERGVLWVGNKIEISLSKSNPKRATATGHFPPGPKTAALVKR